MKASEKGQRETRKGNVIIRRKQMHDATVTKAIYEWREKELKICEQNECERKITG
jgi:hypothetical protein